MALLLKNKLFTEDHGRVHTYGCKNCHSSAIVYCSLSVMVTCVQTGDLISKKKLKKSSNGV